MNEGQEVRLRADMEVALARACAKMGDGFLLDHVARKYIAEQIIRSVNRGETTLTALTHAGEKAAAEYTSKFT